MTILLNTDFFAEKDMIPRNLLDEIIALDHDHFPRKWSREQWMDVYTNFSQYFLSVISHDQQLIGLALFFLPPEDDLSHLLKIVTVPEFRKKGGGMKLLKDSLDFLMLEGKTRCFLEVEERNGGAISLYKKLGFKPLHLAHNFYGVGVSAIKMLKICDNRSV